MELAEGVHGFLMALVRCVRRSTLELSDECETGSAEDCATERDRAVTGVAARQCESPGEQEPRGGSSRSSPLLLRPASLFALAMVETAI